MVRKNSSEKFDIEDENQRSKMIDDMVTRVIEPNITAVKNDTDNRLSNEELQEKIVQPDWSKLEGSFSDLNVIGIGGMGTVFAAKDSLFYRNVALKIMRTDLRTQDKNVNSFIREARITAQIDHPNIVPVYNLGIFQEMGPYFSMKKVDGITLAEILKKLENNDEKFENDFSLRRRLEIFISVCNGVAFAHSKGVVHCDLKPGNIMVGNYGEVFIMDWGMAIYRSDKDLSSKNQKIDLREKDNYIKTESFSVQQSVNGTPAYMAPEQIFGKTDSIDEQTDVYALGVMLYAILTCTQSPYPPKLAAEEIFNRALSGNFLHPRKKAKKRRISRELELVCLKAMSPYKHERYKNVRDLMQDIRNILDMHPVEVYNSPVLNFIKYCRRHPMIPTALVGAAITLGVFYSYFSLVNLLNANALHEVLILNNNESMPIYNRMYIELSRNPNSKKIELEYDYSFDEIKDFELKNLSAKLDLACMQSLEALTKLNDITLNSKYLPQIIKALDFCIKYSLLTHNSENINKIQAIDDGLVYTAYKKIIRNNSKLRRQLQMLSINSAELVFNTDDDLDIFISKQIDQDMIEQNIENKENNNSEMLLKKGSFNMILKKGEYSLLISDKKGHNVTIPVLLDAGENIEINFKFPSWIPPGCVYVHEGEYYSNIFNHYSYGRRVYTDSFFVLDREVTIGEYLEFFKTLTDRKKKEVCNPDLLFHREGKFYIRKLFSVDNKIMSPYTADMPLVGISGEGADAFCEYMSKKLNIKCRLPYFSELEKTARGSGKRLFVWGNRYNPAYALLADNPEVKNFKFGANPKKFPHDYSLYGVYDLTGNVRELVKLKKDINGDEFAVYGGSYKNTSGYAKCGTLSRFSENRTDIGFRYVVEIPSKMQK